MILGIMAGQMRATAAATPVVGISWTRRNAAEANEWFSVAWSPALSLFVAVASTGINRVMTSPDGINWTARSAPASTWRRVCWSPLRGLFVAVADSGSSRVMTSPDGLNWTGRTPPDGSALFDVCWSPSLGRFFAIGYTNPYGIYSSDGVNWVAGGVLDAKTWVGVCWSPELARFVAVGYSGSVSTSADGITWTARSAPARQWSRVAWSAERSLFVVTAQDSSVDNVMTSPDGINWTLRNTGVAAALYGVTYANGLFVVAVSGDGVASGERILTSPDGIAWTARGSSFVGRGRDVVWSPDIGKFVAVLSAGTGGLVMTSP